MKTTMLMTVVLVAATQVLAAQSDLTKQYEAARKQIEVGEVASYSNGLVVIAGQLKKAGDLDNYLLVQGEQKRLVQDAQVAPGLTNGCRVVAEAAQKVLADQNARLVTLLKAYIAKLGESVKALMQADRIDEAKAAKDAMGAAQFELAELEAKMPKVEEAKTNGVAATEEPKEPKNAGYPDLSGTWRERIPLSKEQTGAIFKITQNNGILNCTATHPGASAGSGTAFSVGEGTVTKDGQITMNIRFVKNAGSYLPNVRTCTLAEDGTVSGTMAWQGGSTGFMWKKIPDRKQR